MTDTTIEEATRALVIDKIIPFQFGWGEVEKFHARLITLRGRQWDLRPGHFPQSVKATIRQFVPKAGALVTDSDSGDRRCVYRVDASKGRSGGACAVGCFIHDNNYNTKMEGLVVGPGLGGAALGDLPFTSSAMEVLQNIHDAVSTSPPGEYLDVPDALCLLVDMIEEARSV